VDEAKSLFREILGVEGWIEEGLAARWMAMEARPHVSVIFETNRLVARAMTLAHLDVVAGWLADPEVMRHYPRRYDRAEAEAWVRRSIATQASHGYGRWLMVDRLDGRPVGQVGLLPPRHREIADPEVVWMIDRARWREGLATEAASATLAHAFGPLAIPRLVALIRPENAASAGVAAKLGMTRAGQVVQLDLRHDVYAIDRPAATADRP